MFTQLHEILNADSQDMLILLSIIASHYYNCCTDGTTSPGKYEYLSYGILAFYIKKTIPVTGRLSLWSCEMLKISHCLDNRITSRALLPRNIIFLLLVLISVGG
jgi:hypothetical protein